MNAKRITKVDQLSVNVGNTQQILRVTASVFLFFFNIYIREKINKKREKIKIEFLRKVFKF